jgi:hypothetical protein
MPAVLLVLFLLLLFDYLIVCFPPRISNAFSLPDGGKALFATLSRRLLALIQVSQPSESSTATPFAVSDRLREDAIAAFVAGFRFFYRTTQEQLTFFFGLLAKNSHVSEDEGTRRLLETLCDRLAEWERLSEILIDSTSTTTTTAAHTATSVARVSLSSVGSSSLAAPKTASKSKRTQQKGAAKSLTTTTSSESTSASSSSACVASHVSSTPHAHAFAFLEALVAAALVEAKAKIARYVGHSY